MLCASPLAKGLFQKAISQSGGSFGPSRPTTYPGENMKVLQVVEQDGVDFMNQYGVSTIDELRKLDAEKLIPVRWEQPGGWPIVDGYVIPDDQFKLYEAGEYNDVSVLIGYNSDEGLSFPSGRTPEEFVEGVARRFGPYADSLLAVYPVAEDRIPRSARNLMRDAAFGWQTWSWARLQCKTGKAPVYYYYFDHHPEYPADSPMADAGSPHGMDVAFVFMNLNQESTERDVALAEIMAGYWTNFAKNGDPNGEGLPEWPAFDPENGRVMYLCPEPYVGQVPDEDALKVMDRYFEWRRSPEGAAWAQ